MLHLIANKFENMEMAWKIERNLIDLTWNYYPIYWMCKTPQSFMKSIISYFIDTA